MMSLATDQNVLPEVVRPGLRDLYRVLLVRKNGSEFLVTGDRQPLTLPCIEIPRWQRVAENLTGALKTRYGIAAVCLFAPDMSGTATDCEQPLYQVMEARERHWLAPKATQWLAADSLSERSFADPQDFLALTKTRQQIREFQIDMAKGPFGKPGWIEEMFSWVQREVDADGLRLTGQLRQFNASPNFALLRLETNGAAVWFKAVGEPNLREFSISVALSSLFPAFVPTVIATLPDWNGWLTLEFAGKTLDEGPDASAWTCAARTMAELQMESTGKSDELLRAGCRDLRIAALLPLVDPFMEVMSCLMQQQRKTPPPVLSKGELRTLGSQLKDALSSWAQLNIPDALGHLDFNPGNILCSTDQCVFLDWAEAFVGPPVLTFQYLREHLTRQRQQDNGLDSALVNAYETAWGGLLSPETISAALELAPALAVFAHSAGTDLRGSKELLSEHRQAGYFRSLARRMQFEMRRLQERRELCRS